MRRIRALLLVALVVAPTACADDGSEPGRPTEVLVLAASSLTGAFEAAEAAFEQGHPDIDVTLSFDSSSTLAGQVAEGAPADVLATADENSMDTAVGSGSVTGDPVVFARNRGVIAVPAGTGAVTSPADLGGDVTLAVCAPGVPCRVVADGIFDELGIDPEIATEEENVTAVVEKLVAGEVDAGVVYATDDLAHDELEAIDIGDVVVGTDYPIAAVSDREAAQAFVAFVTSEEGQAILADEGFVAP